MRIKTSGLDRYVDAHGSVEWENDMVEENYSLRNNRTWDLVSQLQEKNVGQFQWVYKSKFTSDGAIEWHEAWLVEKGIL